MANSGVKQKNTKAQAPHREKRPGDHNKSTDATERLRLKFREKYNVEISPTKQYIKEVENRIHEFDINRIWEWNPENMRKFRSFVRRFENYECIYNIMLLDKQYQDLQSNYKLIRFIRDKEKNFEALVQKLQTQMKEMTQEGGCANLHAHDGSDSDDSQW